jgi:hypothetical protein
MTDAAPSATTMNPWLHPLTGGEPPPLTGRFVRALETIARDTEKHATILQDLLHYIEERTR